MGTISVRDLRNRTSDVIARVEAGESITLTVRGRPVADIVPYGQRREAIPAEQFFTELREVLAGLPQGPTEPHELDLTSDDLVAEVERHYSTERAR